MLIGKLFNNIPEKLKRHEFRNLSFDSRNCKLNDIFFSIKGTNKNGNKFIKKAIKNGARTIVSDYNYQGLKNKILYINSKNVRKSLSYAGSKIYFKKPKNLIGITGTNGKSSVANFYYQILSQNKKLTASIGTLGIKSKSYNKNFEITTLDPIALHRNLQILKNKKINNVILEASSHGLKQSRLDHLRFNCSIFTNLSRDHLDYHKNYKDYFKSKLKLFKNLTKKNSVAIFDNDLPTSKILKKICNIKKLKTKTIGKKNSDLNINKISYFKDFQFVKFDYKKKNYSINLKLVGKLQIKNILMACLAAECSGLKFSKIIKNIHKIKPVEGRMEQIKKIKNGSKVILDFAHTPDAMKSSLENLKEQYPLNNLNIVFGCGGNRDKAKRPLMGKIANKYCEKVYITDDNPRNEIPKKIRSQIKSKIIRKKLIEIPSRKNAISRAINNLSSGDILLVAGKGHETYQQYGSTKKSFSDREIIKQEINKKNISLFNDWKLNILNEHCNLSKISKRLISKNILINSKKINKKDIFFGLKGKFNDGSKFADEAIKNGAAFCIVNSYKKKSVKKIKVDNSLETLTKAASKLRQVSNSKIISITGSSGKTSLKELLAFALNKITPTSYSKYSYNNKFGVPLSLLNIKKKHDFSILEVGMDKKGEINKLTNIIKPNLGIITNISYAHIKNFNNLNQIAKAKAEMMNNITIDGTMILNMDDNYFNYLKEIAIKKNLKIISFSKKNNYSNIGLIKIIKNYSNLKLIIRVNNTRKDFIINQNLKPYLSNILAAVAVLSKYFDLNKIDKNIFFNFKIPKSRGDSFKIIFNKKSILLTDESYNSNPLSLNFAVKNFDDLKTKKKKILVLSDMLELGKFSKYLHINAAKSINKTKINKIYVYGRYVRDLYKNLTKNKQGKILKNKNEIYNLVRNNTDNNHHFMFKGSNSTGLQEVVSNIKKRQIYAI